ncbi:MAG: MFS transporter [Rhodospirillales bacterium]|nr:MFS transporter [Rhodospirillales bacterium]
MARSTDLKAAASVDPTPVSTLAAAAPLLLLILVDAIGFAMLTPLLASALADGSDAAIEKGLSPTGRHLVYGVATGLYPIMTFFGAPILGQLSDRLGRKAILLVCAIGIAASYVVISAAFAWGSIALLMAGRAIGGLTAASQAVSLAAVVDVCRPERKDFWLSMGLLCSSLGFVLGPALSGFLSDTAILPWFNLLTPLYATAAVAALNVVMLALLFHDRRQLAASSSPVSLVSGFRSFASAFAKPGPLRDVSWVFLLQELAWGAYFYFIPVFLLDRHGVSGKDASYFMSVMGIGFCVSFAVAMPLLTKYFTTRAITSWSLLGTSVLIAASAFAPSMLVQWMLILPISVAVAVSYGALIILFTDTATEGTKGEVMGITAAINSLSFGSVSFLGGWLEGLSAGAPIIAALALMTMSWLVFSFQKSHSSGKRPT